MSKSELHDWECTIEELSGSNADKMLDIAQDIYKTAFVRGRNSMTWEQEPCDDAISRKQAIRATYGFQRYTGIDEAPYEYAESILGDLPSVTPTRKKGKWIPCRAKYDNVVPIYKCSICHKYNGFEDTNYCPNCGSFMSKGEKE